MTGQRPGDSPAVSAEKTLTRVFSALDEKSRAILWYIWWHGHAHISELRELVGAEQDYDVLRRLNEVINAKSEAVLGRAVVAFRRSDVDPATGETLFFNWWFVGRDESIPPMCDVFVERDEVVVVVRAPDGAEYRDPQLTYRNGLLQMRFQKTR